MLRKLHLFLDCCDNIGLNDTCKAVCYTGMMTDQQCFGSIDKIIACGAGRHYLLIGSAVAQW